jgi:hypothetical protein
VSRSKAARPTPDKSVREPRAVSARQQRDREAAPDPLVMQSVHVGTTCIGFLYSRGRQGAEAFDADTRSLGIYPTLKEAADAVGRAAGGAR